MLGNFGPLLRLWVEEVITLLELLGSVGLA